MQHRIVQHRYPRAGERLAVNLAVQRIVPEVVQADVATGRIHPDVAARAQLLEQRRGVIGHAGRRGRQRGVEPDGHGLFLEPNRAVPTRT